jgi:hypothetical protein
MLRVKYVGETNESFTRNKNYNLHMHNDCFHVTTKKGFHFRALDICLPETLLWFFDNFQPARDMSFLDTKEIK